MQLAELQAVSYDAEVVAVASLLHDLGLTREHQGKRRFEVEGADAARALAKAGGVDDRRAQLIWYCVALNARRWTFSRTHRPTNESIQRSIEIEDFLGFPHRVIGNRLWRDRRRWNSKP